MRTLDLFDLVVWAVRDQMADRDDVGLHEVEIAANGGTHWRTSTCGCASISRIGDIGCAIDGGGQMKGVAPRVHEDAERIVAAVRRLPKNAQYQVFFWARKGEQPEPFTGQQEYVALPSPEGGTAYKVNGDWEDEPPLTSLAERGIRLLDDQGRRRFKVSEPGFRYRTLEDGTKRQWLSRWCPIQKSPEDSWIESVNCEYDSWHAAMMALLAIMLRVELRKHRLRGFEAKRRYPDQGGCEALRAG